MVTAASARVPFVDLQSQYRAIRAEIDPVIQQTIEESAFVMGGRVRDLEDAFATYCGATYGVGCSSGTSALHLAMASAGIGPGDEVILPSHTFIATAEAVLHAGATPIFTDVDPETYCIEAQQIEEVITDRTKAVIPVHLYGQVADMDPILGLAKQRDLLVVEDAAQSHGAKHGDRRAGGMGDFGCFSFYPGKNLGAYGDAGIVITHHENHMERMRLLVNHGRQTKHSHSVVGFNYRLDGIQAAILSVKLRHLDDWNRSRRRVAHRYNELLSGLDLKTPVERRGHVYHLYVIECDDRDGLAESLDAEGISTGVHYPLPLHLQPALSHLPGTGEGRFPVTERLTKRILSLPVFPEMTEEQQDRVVAGIRSFLGG
jgi:dTDP-4-amino-4,6-dideoxygalactose transaminase